MMKHTKQIMCILLCAALTGAAAGCGKQEEAAQTAENSAAIQEETKAVSTEAETQKETKSEKETSAETQSDTQQEETADSETVPESETETAKASTAVSEAAATTTAVSPAATAAAETQAAQQAEEPAAPAEEPAQEEEYTPDVPEQVVVVTEADVINIDAPDPDAVATEPATEAEQHDDVLSMTIDYHGHALTVGESAKAFIDAVKPNFEESAPSCYGDGENINYYYDDMTLYVWNQNDNYMIYSIDISSPGIVSVSGLDIGSSATFDGEKMFDMGNGCNILVIAAGGNVMSISYNKDLS